MITHCHECDTYFRVSIDQLKAANGQVKCGCCMTVFNAIESLLENTETSTHHATPAIVEQADTKTNGSVGSALLGPEETEEPLNTDNEPDTSSWAEINFSKDENEVDEQVDIDFSPDELTETISEENLNFSRDDQTLFEEHIEDASQEAFFEEGQEPSRRSGTIWVVASLLMLTILAFQIIKFNPETVLAKFPQLQPICRFIDCPVPEEMIDTSNINLISRDVREHPQFQDVLLVNATLMNGGNEPQPFPKLQLDLFDKVGRPIGSRQFTPNEYLDSSVDINLGMKPKLPVHIVLEIVGTSEETNSFEFKFL